MPTSSPNAVERLCAPELGAEHRAGASSSAHGVLPCKTAQVESLLDDLRRMPDPRRNNRSCPLPSVLRIVAMALKSGGRLTTWRVWGVDLEEEEEVGFAYAGRDCG